jgi:hypothetical protein
MKHMDETSSCMATKYNPKYLKTLNSLDEKPIFLHILKSNAIKTSHL